MKKLVSWIALSGALAGCGVPATMPHVAPASRPAAATVQAPAAAPALTAAPADPDAQQAAVAPAAADPYADVKAGMKAIAQFGPLVQGVETLDQIGDTPAYAVQTSPQHTQEKADQLAHTWAADAKQVYLGWGFKVVSLFGNSRHVYFSDSKKRLLTVDFGFFGNKVGQYETTGLVAQYAGKYISAILQEPRDIYPVSGRDAYNKVRWNEGIQSTRGTVKCLLIQPYLVGPLWVFLGGDNKPAVVVDASTGEVTTGGWLITLLGYLF